MAYLQLAKHYNRKMAETFEGLSGFCRVVDVIIIYDKDEVSHIHQPCTVISTAMPRETHHLQQGEV